MNIMLFSRIVAHSGVGNHMKELSEELVNQGHKVVVLGISDYLISPSKNEGFLLTAIEAFIMKTPVIRTRTAGFDDQKYCIEIREDNPEDIVRIINDIGHGNAGDYKNRVDEAYRLAMKEFTAEVMAGKTVEVYKKALKGVRSDS